MTALAVPHGLVLVAGALIGGYVVGIVPVAWILVRRARRSGSVRRLDSPLAAAGHGLPASSPGGTHRRLGTVDALRAGGVRLALLVVVLELLKGAVVGLGARVYDDTAWFTATAIAGCVVGDAFPLGVRGGRRGVVPLLSGALAALPGTWSAGIIVALPVILIVALSGAAFEAVIAVTVPAAFVLGTREWRTVFPALLIVIALVARDRLRRSLEDGRGPARGSPAPSRGAATLEQP